MRVGLLLLATAALLVAGPGRASAACTVDPDFSDSVGSGCARCAADGSRCEECGEGYGLKQSDGTCVPCQPVKVGKLLEEDAPVRCFKCDGETPSVCQDCAYLPDRYSATSVSKAGGFPALYPNAKGECEYCPTPGCNQCLPGNGTCVACKVNHGAAPAEAGGVTCVECSGDLPALMCRTCDAKDPKKCLECRTPGTYLKDNKCVDCSEAGLENCDECPDGKTCKTCIYGYAKDASGKCVECPENCDTCSESGKCTVCASGYSSDGQGGCTACKIEGCTNCTASVDSCEPQGCESGYFDAEKKACMACAEGCFSCQGSPDNCYGSCDEGFGLVAKPDNKGACEKCTLENCIECNGDLGKCARCNTTYFLDAASGTCTKCAEGCSDCELTPGNCTACDLGLGLVGTKCEKCQLERCASCEGDLATCDFCLDPYYLSETTKKCEQCPPQCASCSDATTCTSCAAGTDWNDDFSDCVKPSS